MVYSKMKVLLWGILLNRIPHTFIEENESLR